MSEQNLPDRLDVVAVAPHPDDLEILCGGTLAKLVKQGYKVGIFDLASGEPTPRGDPETRKKEAEEARRILGVPVRINIDIPNRVMMDGPEARYKLATEFRRYRPGIIIVAAGRTPAASPDHHQGHLIGEAARFYSQLTKWDDRFGGTAPYRVPHLVYVPYPFDAEARHWHSTFVVDISETIDQKMEAIRAYRSQFDDERFARVKHMV
ncbi:MAG: PIG-L family deacetylase, partial [Gemmataceae bacterium]|nr:PIG-L family deacetylase [Gemmataceae bacterium]